MFQEIIYLQCYITFVSIRTQMDEHGACSQAQYHIVAKCCEDVRHHVPSITPRSLRTFVMNPLHSTFRPLFPLDSLAATPLMIRPIYPTQPLTAIQTLLRLVHCRHSQRSVFLFACVNEGICLCLLESPFHFPHHKCRRRVRSRLQNSKTLDAE